MPELKATSKLASALNAAATRSPSPPSDDRASRVIIGRLETLVGAPRAASGPPARVAGPPGRVDPERQVTILLVQARQLHLFRAGQCAEGWIRTPTRDA